MRDERNTPSGAASVLDRELLHLLRSIAPDDRTLTAPPPELWSRIEREIAAGGGTADMAGSHETADRAATAGTAVLGDGHRDVARRRPWARRAGLVAAGAAAAFALVAAASVLLPRRAIGGRTLAAASLSSVGLPGAPAGSRGQAQVVERGGHRYLRIAVTGVAPRSGEFLELWLIDRQVKGMVSLGVVDGDGDVELPDGLRVADFPIVDVSSEPYDGRPTHSGASLVRGTLA